MSDLTLYIGNKNCSSWSFRAWLAVKTTGIQFKEILTALDTPTTTQQILKFSPTGLVPCLHHGNLQIHDSLAIAEYINELEPTAELFPADRSLRAVARSLCSEMHSGFRNLRQEFPMNMKHDAKKNPSEHSAPEIQRILQIWSDTKSKFGHNGPFLMGKWSIMDVFFAPVVARFKSYHIDRPIEAQKYIEAVSNYPLYTDWRNAALKEGV